MIEHGVSLATHEQGLTFIEPHKSAYAETILSCLRDRTKVQHSLLTGIITILATHWWKTTSENIDFVITAIDNLSTRFQIPLEKAKVDITLLKEIFADMLDHAKRYLNLHGIVLYITF